MIIIAPLDPFTAGFDVLLEESRQEGQRMLVRLRDNWNSGANRFELPGEVLKGVFYVGNRGPEPQLVATGGRNVDPYSNERHAGRIRHLYVMPSMRRQGVGQLLIEHLVEDASRYFNYLNTHAPETAHAFYQRLGFEPVSGDNHVTHRLAL